MLKKQSTEQQKNGGVLTTPADVHTKRDVSVYLAYACRSLKKLIRLVLYNEWPCKYCNVNKIC